MEVEPNTIISTIKSLQKNKTAAGIGGQVVWKKRRKNGTLDRPRKEDQMLMINDTTYIEALYSRYFTTYKKFFSMLVGMMKRSLICAVKDRIFQFVIGGQVIL